VVGIEEQNQKNVEQGSSLIRGCRYIHSDVWERIVLCCGYEHELTAMVAYGLYQRRKREWIEYHKLKHGDLPSEDEVKAYSVSQRDTAINGLINEAEAKMFRFADDYANGQLPTLQKRAFNKRTKVELAAARDELKNIGKYIKSRTGFRHHVIAHILGLGALLVIIAFFTFALNFDKSPLEIVNVVREKLSTNSDANSHSTAAKPDDSTPRSPP
jgi:hypothetical protein